MSDSGLLPNSSGCFVCGRDNQHGLRLRFRTDGELISTEVTLPRHANGFPGRTHGGVVAALLDETMGWATTLAHRRFTFTAELTVRYLEPVPVEMPLRVEGRVDRFARRLSHASARVLTADGRELATAVGKFVPTEAEVSRAVAAQLASEEPWPEGVPTADPPDRG